MTISEKVAYLKGLMEGLSIPTDTPEGKVLNAMADILSDMALTVEDLEKETGRLGDYVEELDEDLGDVEEYLFTEDEDDSDEEAEEEDADDFFDEDDEDEESDEDIYALECPSCGETIYLDESLLDETDILCPACHEPISFDIEEEDEEIEDPDVMDAVPECDKPAFNYESSD
ncbi:MAG: hypothetical protein IJX47_06840 [Clostridia bacterium]|nr:hypothetical protein [Clostridia bacterium]